MGVYAERVRLMEGFRSWSPWVCVCVRVAEMERACDEWSSGKVCFLYSEHEPRRLEEGEEEEEESERKRLVLLNIDIWGISRAIVFLVHILDTCVVVSVCILHVCVCTYLHTC